MNIDYKYVAGSTDPMEIINKNRMRGFGTWLNETEIKDLIKYSLHVPFGIIFIIILIKINNTFKYRLFTFKS